jgi:hypothetical protein
VRLVPLTEHVDKMAEILLTYGFFEGELGYVQGMSDLLSPLYVVFDGDEVMTFWSFVEWMERMVRPSSPSSWYGSGRHSLTLVYGPSRNQISSATNPA